MTNYIIELYPEHYKITYTDTGERIYLDRSTPIQDVIYAAKNYR